MRSVPSRLAVVAARARGQITAVTDHGARVIIVGQEGYSSSLSAAWLRALGMRNVADVEGGFDAWRDAGLPIEPLKEP